MDPRPELPFSTLLWQPRAATWLVTVVCKATFSLEPGELQLAAQQEPLFEHDAYWDDNPERSLCAASDVVPSKTRCDVLLVGHAFAPPGKQVNVLVARLVFDSIDKSLGLVADRSMGPDGTVYQGRRFARMPLVYERAAGGPGTWNPVGVGARAQGAHGPVSLPNVTPLGKADETIHTIEPIGFGPIATGWPQRASKNVGQRAAFGPETWGKAALPEGFDLSYFNVAPPDQQLDAIPEGAPLLLEGLHPQHPRLATKLPGVRPLVTLERRGQNERPRMRPDTLWIDTDRRLVMLTWRGHFGVEHPAEAYRIAIGVERPRHSWRTAQHAVGALVPQETLLDALGSEPTNAERGSPMSSRGASGPAGLLADPDRRAWLEPPGAGLPFKQPKAPGPGWTSSYPASSASRTAPPPALPAAHAGAVPGLPATIPPPPPMPAPPLSAVQLDQLQPPPAGQTERPPPPPEAQQPAAAGNAPTKAHPWSAAGGAVVAPPPPVHASAAALGGLVSASNAAADQHAGKDHARGAPVPIQGDVLHLLWFNSELAPRIRRRPQWKKILDLLEQGAFDPELDEPALAEEPAELEDRREVYEVLARATPSGQDGLDRALLEAVRPDGRYAAQLLVVLGEVRFDFDEIELLKATVSAATPFATTDDELKKTLAVATAFLSTPGLVAAPDVAASMIGRVRSSFGRVGRPAPASYLDDQTERALLERRAYQKRSVFGAPHLRSLFFFAGASHGIPTYFPDVVARKLPLFRRLRVRLLVEANFQADQYEIHATAFKVGAVARVVR